MRGSCNQLLFVGEREREEGRERERQREIEREVGIEREYSKEKGSVGGR